MRRLISFFCVAFAINGCATSTTGMLVSPEAEPLGGSLFIEFSDGESGLLVLDGPITPETSYTFLSMLESAEVNGLFIAQSEGGDLLASHQIGDAIRARGINTALLAYCFSACVDVFIAGKEREIGPDAELGLHAASDRAFGYSVDKIYWKKMGFDAINEAVYGMPQGGVWFIDAARARELGLATGTLE